MMWEGGARGSLGTVTLVLASPTGSHTVTQLHWVAGNSRLCNYQAYQPFENNDAKIAVTLYSSRGS